jgi:hypothetical protein
MATSKKVITYQTKSTMARTEYRKVDRDDQKWVLDQLEDWMVRMDGFSKSRVRDLEDIYDQFWTAKTKDLPKGRDGLNSPFNMVEGILRNMRYDTEGKQYDFSKPQCDGIEGISRCIHTCFGDACPEIKFEKKGV